MASLPCFRLPGGVGLDGGSPWGPQFLAGTLRYQSEPPRGQRPEVHILYQVYGAPLVGWKDPRSWSWSLSSPLDGPGVSGA